MIRIADARLLIRPDGDVRYAPTVVQGINNNGGAAVRALGSLQDNTEQVKAAQLLHESEKRTKLH